MKNWHVYAFFLVFATYVPAYAEGFTPWLQEARDEAQRIGISKNVINQALPMGLIPDPVVLKLDRKQPEKTKSLSKYLGDILTPRMIRLARQNYATHRVLLEKIGNEYGVDPALIVALWGIETNFGANTGNFDVVRSLATLAYDGRRGAYFRQELMNALKMLEGSTMVNKHLRGSWAGAMGQVQFMPSTFLKYAQDFDKDGHRNIWSSQADAFASAAYYLSSIGWKKGQPWGHAVTVPKGFNRSYLGLDKKYSLQFWKDAGIRMENGNPLPFEGSYLASVIQPDGEKSATYLVYENYRSIMTWNKSTYFATAVSLLMDQIKG